MSDLIRPTIHVACGVLCRPDGQVLMAQRPAGKIAAGWWEFPGGKIEAGETPLQALKRELHEELGVELRAAQPLIRFAHDYSNRRVVLDTWLVTAFDGAPQSREQQAFAWLPPSQLATQEPALPTVAPIAQALRLAPHYVFTPPDAEPRQCLPQLACLPAGALLRLRWPGLSDGDYARVATEWIAASRSSGLQLLLDRDPALAETLGAAGWHADSRTLMSLSARPPGLALCIASVHDATELQRAVELGFDAAVLGPVLPTASHPGAPALGWSGFAERRGLAPIPVYALGGLGPGDLEQAQGQHAQGVAGISAYWSS
ncbi:Nudix family hydrolase [Stagnimonas aquatica]|uniref:Nudix family hydrolase n=1 Tax=Stagnimonas aquatica TaxID=2689987 RepID=UPI0013158AE3|nr:Nudix family hydrolase [Stagnimonas aquatica]